MNFTGQEAERLADAIEAKACCDLYVAAPAALRLSARTVKGATILLAPTLPVTYLNRVIGCGDEPSAVADILAEAATAYGTAGVQSYWIHLTPSAQTPQSLEMLQQRGFALASRRSWAKFLREVTAPPIPRTDLTIREATHDDATTVAAVVCAAYGMPPPIAPWFAALVGRPNWQVWVALHQGRIVATGSMFIDGDSAWLGVGATLAEYRGRGGQSALLAVRIRAAAAVGCRVVATETGEPVGGEPNPSLDNIRRMGFVQVCSRLNYAAPAMN